jgi:hypothetical protein
MSWQNMRSMTDVELRQALSALGLSRAAAARYLGLGSRTIYGYCDQGRKIPTQTALLLNALVELNITPMVPPTRHRSNPDASSAANRGATSR